MHSAYRFCHIIATMSMSSDCKMSINLLSKMIYIIDYYEDRKGVIYLISDILKASDNYVDNIDLS